MSQAEPVSIVADLAEDLLTAWVPDVAGSVDLPLYAEGHAPGADPLVRWLDVPKAEGAPIRVPVLHPGWHVHLHQTVAPLRDAVDTELPSAVYGYRRGAEAGFRYSDAWRAFQLRVHEHASSAGFVVEADIRHFFGSAGWQIVVSAVERLIGVPASASLRAAATIYERRGLPHLPAGYSDARMLANALLAAVDRKLPVPFARWVDDYRLFVAQEVDPEVVLAGLRDSLRALGLELNEEKTRILPGTETRTRYENTLGQITTRDEARAAFRSAVEAPEENRRALRFLLRRLEKDEDPTAVPYAVDALERTPWDAPRLVSYLAAFVDQDDVASGVEQALLGAAESGDAWLTCRLAPLAVRTGLSPRALDRTASALPSLADTPAWGLGLRLLSLAGRADDVQALIGEEPADFRAAIAAFRDLGLPVPAEIVRAEPTLEAALAGGPAPRPKLASIL